MSMFTISSIAASLSALALAGTVATGTSTPDTGKAKQDRGAKRHGKIERLCKRLECTPQQRDQLAEIARELRTDLRQGREAMKSAKAALADEYRKPTPDESNMKRQYAAMDRHRQAQRDRTHAALMSAHAVLTPEQRSKLANRIEKRGPKAVLGGKGKAKAKHKAKRRKAKKAKRSKGKGKGKRRAKVDGGQARG